MERAKQQQGDLLDDAVKANIVLTRDQLTNSEPLLAASVKAAKLKIVGAYYDLDTGEVTALSDT